MSERTSYPLCWPDGWKRTTSRRASAFGKSRRDQPDVIRTLARLSVSDGVLRVLHELKLMGVSRDDVIVSTNVELRLDGWPRSDREPADPGVAVYWKRKGQMRCIAVDQYNRVADNLAAIAATLEAMRAIDRHGGAQILDRAFVGFAALPARASSSWRETLGIEPQTTATIDLVESRFRALSRVHHPDTGGDRAKFEELVAAREAAKIELSGAA